jgi:hypothetical protein
MYSLIILKSVFIINQAQLFFSHFKKIISLDLLYDYCSEYIKGPAIMETLSTLSRVYFTDTLKHLFTDQAILPGYISDGTIAQTKVLLLKNFNKTSERKYD